MLIFLREIESKDVCLPHVCKKYPSQIDVFTRQTVR
jgi:hypothetical protein